MNGLGGLGGGMDVGHLRVLLGADITAYEKEMARSQSIADMTGAQLVRKFKNVATAVAGVYATVGAVSVNQARKFDKAMTESVSIMGKVSDDMRRQMEDTARALSKTTRTSATEAAQAYYYLASAGMDAKQSIAALPAVEKFATAGAFDMAQATDLLTDAQTALGLSSKDAAKNLQGLTRLSDVLVKANTLANASVEQFSKALTTKSASALRLLNKDVEEGVAVLAAYADQGVKAELAGERLSIMLRDLQTASINNSEAWDQLGLRVYDANGKMLPIVGIIEQLEYVLGNASDEQKKLTLMMLGFTDMSVAAITQLMGVSGKIRDYETALRSAAGTTEDVANKQLASFHNQLLILRNQVNDVVIGIGQAMIPALLAVMTQFKEATAQAETYNNSMRKMADFMTTVLLTAVGAVGTGFQGWGIILKGGELLMLQVLAVGGVMTQGLVDLLLWLVNKAREFFKMIGEVSIKAFKVVMTAGASMVEKVVNLMLAGINKAIEGINGLVSKLPPWMRPDGEIPTIAWNLNINTSGAEAKLDALASGIAGTELKPVEMPQGLRDYLDSFVEAEKLTRKEMEDLLNEPMYMTDLLDRYGKSASGQQKAALGTPAGQVFDPSSASALPGDGQLSSQQQGSGAGDAMGSLTLEQHLRTLKAINAEEEKRVEHNQSLLDYWREGFDVLQPIEVLSQSIQMHTKELLMGTISWKDALLDIAGNVIASIINQFVAMAAQYLAAQIATIMGVQAASTAAAGVATATTMASASAVSAAWIPAAIAASIATMGSAAAIGTTAFVGALLAGTAAATVAAFVGGLTTSFAQGAGTAIGTKNSPSYDGGGYTGKSSRTGGVDGKGGFYAILHPQETVIDHFNQRASALPSFEGGGRTSPVPSYVDGSGVSGHGRRTDGVVVNINNQAGVNVEATRNPATNEIDVVISEVSRRLADDVRTGRGPLPRALEGTYVGAKRGRM